MIRCARAAVVIVIACALQHIASYVVALQLGRWAVASMECYSAGTRAAYCVAVIAPTYLLTMEVVATILGPPQSCLCKDKSHADDPKDETAPATQTQTPPQPPARAASVLVRRLFARPAAATAATKASA